MQGSMADQVALVDGGGDRGHGWGQGQGAQDGGPMVLKSLCSSRALSLPRVYITVPWGAMVQRL